VREEAERDEKESPTETEIALHVTIDRSEVLGSCQTKHQEKRDAWWEGEPDNEDEQGDEKNAFLMQCASQGPTQDGEQETRECANGSDRIKNSRRRRQRYVTEITKKPSLYKSYTKTRRTKQNIERIIFLKKGGL